MKKYHKENSRLTVKYVDSETEEVLFEIKDRNWSNVGELLSDYHVDEIVKRTLKQKNISLPDNIMIIVVGDYELK